AAPTEESSSVSSCVGTRLPMLRTVNRSPGPLEVITFGTTRESAQVMKSAEGCCRWASPLISDRIRPAVLEWYSRAPASSRPEAGADRSNPPRMPQGAHQRARPRGVVLPTGGDCRELRSYQF